MKRPVKSFAHVGPTPGRIPRGYTIVEILVATVLMLIMMVTVTLIFGAVAESINNSRAALEMSGRLRAAAARMQQDLEGLTVTTIPPQRPGSDKGYLEYTEGPNGPVIPPGAFATNIDTGEPDSTVGDIDDLVMFTTRSQNKPFIGRAILDVKRAPLVGEPPTGKDVIGDYFRYTMSTIESHEAEVAWFLRGRTLYRRVLLVYPEMDQDRRTPQRELPLPPTPTQPASLQGFFALCDLSVRNVGGNLAANTLGDLTKPQNRFAHQPSRPDGTPADFPFHPHFWVDWSATFPQIRQTLWASVGGSPALLGLPTLRECSHPDWNPGGTLPAIALSNSGSFDAWVNPYPWQELDQVTGTFSLDPVTVPPSDPNFPPLFMGSRVGDDVILTNVVGFDVKAWDPGAPVLRVTNAATNLATVVVPGDQGYIRALKFRGGADPADSNITYAVVGFGAFVDLNYMCLLGPGALPSLDPNAPNYAPPAGMPEPHFHGAGEPRSRLRGTPPYAKDFGDPADWPPALVRRASVYDTWSFHYEHDGINQDRDQHLIPDPASPGNTILDPLVDEGTNGFDDPGNGLDDNTNNVVDDADDPPNGIVDDAVELEAPPPYSAPLRGIQIKIRTFEPDSRRVREVTIVQYFPPK